MNEELLRTYSKELYSCKDTPLTLEQLILSHRYLRSLNLDNREVRNKIFEEARAQGRKEGYDEVTKGEYIASEELRKITVNELIEFFVLKENEMTRNFYVIPMYLVGEDTNVIRVAESADFPYENIVIETIDKSDEEYFGKIRLDMSIEFMRLLANTILKVCDEVQKSSDEISKTNLPNT